MKEQAAIAAAVTRERLVFLKTGYPSTIELAPWGGEGLNPSKSGEKVPLSITECYGL